LDLKDFFDLDSCDLCGECLRRCPVLGLSLKEAKLEIKRLVEGRKTKVTLRECTGCFSCNLYCPKGLTPYYLILFRWYERYKEKGLPGLIRLALPYQPPPNIWLSLHKMLPEDEKMLLKSWASPTISNLRSAEVLFLGCNQLLNPYIANTSLFNDLTPLGSRALCCGEPYFRLGLFDQVSQIARRLERYFKTLKIKRMVFFCPAGYNMFKNILPEKFGVRFDFEIKSLLEWLWERIEGGKIKIKKELSKTVTIQDSCHGKSLGPDFLKLSRKILNEIGMEVIEMEHKEEDALCCGLGGVVSRFSILDMVKTSLRRLKEAEKTKAQVFAPYCNGCLITFSLSSMLHSPKIPLFHLIELLQLATGEEPKHRHSLRAKQLLLASSQLLIPAVIAGKKGVYLKDIPLEIQNLNTTKSKIHPP